MATNENSDIGAAQGAMLMDQARELCRPILQAAITELSPPLGRMAGYHFGWWDAAGTVTGDRHGNALRAALTLGAATACGDSPAAAVPAAAAIELLHGFTLLHDDVMDEGPTRRGRPAVWRVWGVGNAILAGDALYALAFKVLREYLPVAVAHEAIGRLTAASLELCQGQYEDCAFEQRSRVTLDEYLRMAVSKTAALMGCACAVGALCADADPGTVSAMDRFGRELGLVFQFVDDIIGIWGDPSVTGKPVGNDLQRRKYTLPVVAAMSSDGGAAVELASLYNSPGQMTPADVIRAAALVEAAGGRHVAEQYADERLAAAIDALPDRSTSAHLLTLTRVARHRDR
jgi:geranylgeranyl diphosphate synthase type I